MTRPTTRHNVTSGRGLLDRVFRNPDTGQLAIAQWPNVPLVVFLVGTAVRAIAHPTGTAATLLSIVTSAALTWWAVDEVLRGESLFRRALGGVVLAAMVIGLLTR